jgi:hyaluronan synthase
MGFSLMGIGGILLLFGLVQLLYMEPHLAYHLQALVSIAQKSVPPISLSDIVVFSASMGPVTLFAILIRTLFRKEKRYNEIIRRWPSKNVNTTTDYKTTSKQRPLIPSFLSIHQSSTLRRVPVPADAPRAKFSRMGWFITAAITAPAIIWLTFFRSQILISSGVSGEFRLAYWFIFITLIIQMFLAYLEQPIRGKGKPDERTVIVCMSAFNEDKDILASCLYSQLYQSRLPNIISVTDDGSTQVDYTDLVDWFADIARQVGVAFIWTRTDNHGKRHGQTTALKEAVAAGHKPTHIITIDSDCVGDPDSNRQVLLPFDDPKVKSVAGIVLASNNQVNLLARFTDVLFVTQQFIDRSAMSTVGCVLVNSGGLAAYEAAVFLDNEEAYLNETFGTMPVRFSDDSMACLFALMSDKGRGKTVQQPSAFTFTAMPDNFGHHRRQQDRWWKGSFIRSWWRLKYLPILSWGYARQFFGWVQTLMTLEITLTLLVIDPIFMHQAIPWQIAIIPFVAGYGLALRYWTYRRSDMSLGSHLLNYLLTGVAVMWSLSFMRFGRFYSMATVRVNKGWGTRKKVEVKQH